MPDTLVLKYILYPSWILSFLPASQPDQCDKLVDILVEIGEGECLPSLTCDEILLTDRQLPECQDILPVHGFDMILPDLSFDLEQTLFADDNMHALDLRDSDA